MQLKQGSKAIQACELLERARLEPDERPGGPPLYILETGRIAAWDTRVFVHFPIREKHNCTNR